MFVTRHCPREVVAKYEKLRPGASTYPLCTNFGVYRCSTVTEWVVSSSDIFSFRPRQNVIMVNQLLLLLFTIYFSAVDLEEKFKGYLFHHAHHPLRHGHTLVSLPFWDIILQLLSVFVSVPWYFWLDILCILVWTSWFHPHHMTPPSDVVQH